MPHYKQITNAQKERIAKFCNKGLTIGAIAKLVQVSRFSVYKYANYKASTLPDNYEFFPLFLKKRIITHLKEEEEQKCSGCTVRVD